MPEHVQKLLQRDLLGVVDDLDDLVVARPAAPDLLIGGVGDGAAREAARDFRDAGDAFEGGLGAPEAARRDDERVGVLGRDVQRRGLDGALDGMAEHGFEFGRALGAAARGEGCRQHEGEHRQERSRMESRGG